MRIINKLLYALMAFLLFNCGNESKRFTSLPESETGIGFINELNPTTDLNIFNYLYFYNGGGVAAGDLNGDELPDLFFTSNQGLSKLYLNKGNLKFQDITDQLKQQVRPNQWVTGVSFVDINSDGRLDIYVCEIGSYLKLEGYNKLYINLGNDESGIPQFEERGKQFGLDLVGFSTQAAFFDYDLDGDIDLYQLNHSVHSNGTFGRVYLRSESHPLAGDRLMRNDGGHFTDVTKESGIYNSAIGYGLGIGISDINNDGFPDIYVGNDFHEDDYLYINQGDGTFKESLEEMIHHTSRFSMGNDLADINNDGRIDILSLDMLPREYQKLKSSAGEDVYDVYQYKLRFGYKYQNARNTLQLNRGNGSFSEIGLLSGIAATDWSWAGLMADFDLDGRNDIFVANGIMGRTNDVDYIKYISSEAIQYRLEGDLTEDELLLTNKMPKVKIPNYAFRNKGNLSFEDVSEKWGLNQETFSNGAVYVDLDLDGDLEIVTNNIGQPASVYRNNTRELDNLGNYLRLKFKGPRENPFGIGVKVKIPITRDSLIVRELYPVRGFQSSLDYSIYLGLDTVRLTERIQIIWPDGKEQILANVESNQRLIVNYENASVAAKGELNQESSSDYFADMSDHVKVDFNHSENHFVEFNREFLIPNMVSAEGPAYARGDLNGDGRDDIFLGGAKHGTSSIFYNEGNFIFRKLDLNEDPVYEDVDACIADFNSDGKNDLFVLSGGNEFSADSKYTMPRLYINDGAGKLVRDTINLPEIHLTGSVLAAADFDNDGDIDVFVGARAVPWSYGIEPESYFLINNNGKFTLDKEGIGAFGKKLGMVTGAKWGDMNSDGLIDLVISSEWSTIKIIYNYGTRFELKEIEDSRSLWNTIELADLDQDGQLDIIGGSLGLNSKFHATPSDPLRMYVYDFDGNGSVEQIITLSENSNEQLFADKELLMKQLPVINKRYPDFTSFSKATLKQIFPNGELTKALKYEVDDLRSSVFYQNNSKFEKRHLPVNSQFAPIRAIVVHDVNRDSKPDLLTAGNFFRATIELGRYDADYGNLMINDGGRNFKSVDNEDINLFIDGQVQHMDLIAQDNTNVLVVVRNNDRLKFYRLK